MKVESLEEKHIKILAGVIDDGANNFDSLERTLSMKYADFEHPHVDREAHQPISTHSKSTQASKEQSNNNHVIKKKENTHSKAQKVLSKVPINQEDELPANRSTNKQINQ